jgi:hypothetical protein
MTMRYADLSKEFARQEIQNLSGLTSEKVKKQEAVTAMTAPHVAKTTVTKVSQSPISVTVSLG